MHTIIHRNSHNRFPNEKPAVQGFRSPHYECIDMARSLKLVIYVPGVDESGIEIITQGPDVFVTARKTHLLRANWQALHLERVQRDYQLKLRLGTGFDFDAMQASVTGGVLTIVLPKRETTPGLSSFVQRQVA